MTTSTVKSAYMRGVRDGFPFLFVVSPFAMLFGVVATEAGLNVFESLTFSLAVIAGAAQFTAIQLMQDGAPTIVVLASALAVNLRMAMYSAHLTPHLGAAPLWVRGWIAYFLVDQTYAMSVGEFERVPDMTLSEKIAYFFGTASPVCPFWYIMTVVGALLGNAIPGSMALDFAVPITFIALTMPMLRTPAHVIAAVVSVITALLTVSVPYNLGLIISGVAGMLAGAQAELMLGRRT